VRAVIVLAIVLVVPRFGGAAPPKLNNLFPAGCQRGQSVVVTATGDFSAWPVEVWSDRPGIVATAEKDKGKLKVDVAADAVPGVYWLRLYNNEGASVLKPFVVGTLAEVAESEPNDAPSKPQSVEPRVVVSGKLGKSGDVDGYRVELRQGQTLVASLQANSVLGAPMDAVLQVCDLVERPSAATQTQHVEAYVATQNHDAIGLDPQVAFTAPRDGAYLVRLFAFPATPDSSVRFAGGDDYIYRLTLTTGAFVDHALPLAVPREESQVLLGGWNLAHSAAIIPPLAAEAELLTPPDGPLTWAWRADAAGAAAVPRTEYPSLVEPAEIPVPGVVSGRLQSPGETDAYTFTATKNQKLRIRVAAKALGYPTDAIVAVLDEAGKTLAEADDTGRDDRDPTLDFSPPADGTYKLLVRDLARRGEMRMVYRLTIEPVQPDFSLTLAADSFVLEKDKPLEVTVNVVLRDGLKEAIEIRAIGLPPGVTAEPVKFQPSGDSPMAENTGRRGKRGGNTQPSGPSVKLVLKCDAAAVQPGGAPIRIEGATGGSSPVVRSARFPLNLPLAGSHHAVWLTVR
jgi:Bacterial pre-peptidase C-terminal domain